MFNRRYNLNDRKQLSSMYIHRYPNRIPVIIREIKNGPTVNPSRNKFLVLRQNTIAQFLAINRKELSGLDSMSSIFLFISNGAGSEVIPRQTDTFESIYNTYKDQDGFLYISVSYESCFGGNSELEDNECLICYEKKGKLVPICSTHICDGYKHGVCEECLEYQTNNHIIQCPVCRRETVIEAVIDGESCCTIS